MTEGKGPKEPMEDRIESVVVAARIWSDDLDQEETADFFGHLSELFAEYEVDTRERMGEPPFQTR